MQLSKILPALLIFIVPSFALAHGGDESRVAIELESSPNLTAGRTVVSFQLVDTEKNIVLTPTELSVNHEKKLHFIAYDPALKEFQHVHPDFDGKVWNVDMNFAVDGNYFVWAQGQLSSESTEFSSFVRIDVSGGLPAWPAPVLGDVRTGAHSGTVATLSSEVLHAGQMVMLTLQFTRIDGTPTNITPYLGAFAHVIATPIDGDSLIHIHPMNGTLPNEGMVHVTFPDAGDYRIWVQFIDGGILKTVPLSVTVTK